MRITDINKKTAMEEDFCKVKVSYFLRYSN